MDFYDAARLLGLPIALLIDGLGPLSLGLGFAAAGAPMLGAAWYLDERHLAYGWLIAFGGAFMVIGVASVAFFVGLPLLMLAFMVGVPCLLAYACVLMGLAAVRRGLRAARELRVGAA